MNFRIISLLILFISCKSLIKDKSINKEYIIEKYSIKNNAIDGESKYYYVSNIFNKKPNDLFKNVLNIRGDLSTINCCLDTIFNDYSKINTYQKTYNQNLVLDDLMNNNLYFKRSYNGFILKFYKVKLEFCKCKGDYINYTNTYKDYVFICPYKVLFFKINKNDRKQIKFKLNTDLTHGTDH